MSRVNTKTIFVNVRDLSFKSEQIVIDLIRYIVEQLPQIEVIRNANELEIVMPINMSKRVIRLRIKKFLYKKALNDDFRPISYRSYEKDIVKDGYMVKEKKILEMTYY